MVNIQFQGPAGRIEGRYYKSDQARAPLALILHPHPKFGGTMNNKVVYTLFNTLKKRGFSVLRFNFRGVGMSEGEYDNGVGELADAASAMDWLQNANKDSQECWVVGFSFGAWISMQLLMRRPEIQSFISVAPPANMFDFNFLAPCPSSGLIINGADDKIVPPGYVKQLADKLKIQKRITIEHTIIEDAGHFFEDQLDELSDQCDEYLVSRKAGAGNNFLTELGID
ncbi:MAG: alpha/beta superfamily hydrolase [Alphaproteobacteria bacterium]|jgi:alpha/beta superfamily hydrolase